MQTYLEQSIKHVREDNYIFESYITQILALPVLKTREFKLPVLARERAKQTSLKLIHLLLQAVLEVFKV